MKNIIGLFTGGNVSLLHLWGAENGPWMQALHFVFGLGAIVGPQLVAPFLAQPVDRNISMATDMNVSHVNETVLPNVSMGDSMVQIPYGIAGSVTCVIGIIFLILFVKDGAIPHAIMKDDPSKNKGKAGENEFKQYKVIRISIIVILTCFYMAMITVLVAMSSLMVMFCVQHLGWSKSMAVNLTTVFWASFTISRGIGILLIKCLRPRTIIFADICIALIGFVPLLFALTWHPAVMWVGSVVIAGALAPVYASGISWANEHIKVTEAVSSVFVIGSSASSIYGPILIVYLMEEVGYMWFIYFLFANCVACLALMIIMQLLGN